MKHEVGDLVLAQDSEGYSLGVINKKFLNHYLVTWADESLESTICDDGLIQIYKDQLQHHLEILDEQTQSW